MSDDREALMALAERAEQATGPDRELDRDIAAALRIGPVYKLRGRISASWPDFTASLDAAMTLVPEGWRPLIDCTPDDHRPVVELFDNPDQLHPADIVRASAATPALALTAACLRAHATKRGEANG